MTGGRNRIRKTDYAKHIHRLGHKVNAIAKQAEVSPQTMRAFLRGEWKRINENRRVLVAEVLGMTMDELEVKITKGWRT